MVNPVNGTGSKEMHSRGRLGVYKQDLLAHKDGTGFRQDATTIDMNPSLTYFPETTVQDTLESIETFLMNDSTFCNVGNGTTSFGMFNIGDPGYPTIESCLIGAMNTLRLSGRGGIILVKAGVYNFTSTVSLDLGISVIGEVGGTILNAQSANPIFEVTAGARETIRVGSVYAETSQITRFYNLTFTDAFGDVNPYLNLSSIISCDRGTSVSVEKCSVFGKIGAGGAPPIVTRLFIGYNGMSTSIYNTILNIENCYIAGIQQVVDFDIETARDNKLTVRNNRIWVSGRVTGSTARDTSAVAFRCCDANLSHNQIKFGLAALLESIRTAFACYDAGSDVKNLIIMGNQGSYLTEAAASITNRLLDEDASGLDNFRSCISGNMMGGSSDSGSWYITVGDGANSVGDINGALALQNIVKYFISMPRYSTSHGNVVIYIKPGTYTITDETCFEVASTTSSMPLALIGVTENGNLPIIELNVASPTVGGQKIIFGHRLENLYFKGATDYYKIMLRNDFTNISPTRTVFFRDVHVKNCGFYNCSIGIVNATATASTEYMKNNIFIEDCQFANSAIINNLAAPESMVAIYPGYKNGKIFIRRCHTVSGQYRGLFFNLDSTNADTLKYTDVSIEDCIYTTLNCGASDICVYMLNIKNASISNCKFDTSNATTQPIRVVSCLASTNNTTENKVNAIDCHFKGGGASPPIGLVVNAFDKVNIDKNTFENLSAGIYCGLYYNGSTTTIEALNVNIHNNRAIIGASSYGFISVIRSGTPTNIVNGTISIKNNSLDMQAKTAATLYALTATDNVYAPILVKAFAADYISVEVSENNITKFTAVAGTSPDIEAAIAVLNSKYSKICKNNISFRSTSLVRDFDGIHVSLAGPSGVYASNSQGTDISENKIISENSVYFVNKISCINVKDVDFVNIKSNILIKSAGSLTWFIYVYSDSVTAGNEGVICDNILSEELTNGGIRYKTSAVHNNIKLYVGRNKNQKVIQEIDCTDFKRYGYNRNTAQPNSDAICMLKSNALATGHAGANNKNKEQLHILKDGLLGSNYYTTITTWATLPEGLYYTNAYEDNVYLQPKAPVLTNVIMFGPHSQTNHQVLIPLRLPDYIKITKIEIPIYWRNTSGVTKVAIVSASLICGNDTDNPTKIEYITDTPATWDYVPTTILTMSESKTSLSTTISNLYLNPTRNTTGGTGTDYLTTVNCYILLSLGIFTETTAIADIYFAIPHAKVTYTF
jgi:hypothetical protein